MPGVWMSRTVGERGDTRVTGVPLPIKQCEDSASASWTTVGSLIGRKHDSGYR